MKYFVCFAYEREGKISVGNTCIEMNKVITEHADIIQMEYELENKAGIFHPIVLNYKLLEETATALEYVRCGDSERLVTKGNFSLCPQIKVSSKMKHLDVEELVHRIEKMFITKNQE